MLAITSRALRVALAASLVACAVADDGDADASSGEDSSTGEAEAATAAIADPALGTTASRGACSSYCTAYAMRCAGSIAFATPDACSRTCSGWTLGGANAKGDTLRCRAAWLEAAPTSCIAAGPRSPICKDGNITAAAS